MGVAIMIWLAGFAEEEEFAIILTDFLNLVINCTEVVLRRFGSMSGIKTNQRLKSCTSQVMPEYNTM